MISTSTTLLLVALWLNAVGAQYLCTGDVPGVAGCVNPANYPAPQTSYNPTLCGAVGSVACGLGLSGCPHCDASLQRWDVGSTWSNNGNMIPVSGIAVNVTLPVGSRVLLTGCMLAAGARFRMITIPQGSEVGIRFHPTRIIINL